MAFLVNFCPLKICLIGGGWKGTLFEACKKGNAKIVKLFLDNKNADFHSPTIARWSEFMWACHNGHKDAEANFDFLILSCSILHENWLQFGKESFAR